MEDIVFHKSSLLKKYQWLVLFVAAFVFGLLSPSRAAAQTIWTLTIDFSKGDDAPSYDVTTSGTSIGGCSYPVPSDGYSITICPGDYVVWKAKTPGKKYSLRVYFPLAALNDSSSKLAHWFEGDDANVTTGGQTGVSPDDHVQYQYAVSVYDKGTGHNKLYLHDPRIIIGTGGKSASNILHDLNSDAKQLDRSLQDNLDEEVRKDLKKLQEIIDELGKHINKQ
jgi:hypothetical protein